MKTKKQIEVLEAELKKYNHAYYAEHEQLVSDGEYDIKKRELLGLYGSSGIRIPNDSALSQVGSDPTSNRKKIKHSIRMGSLDNVWTAEELVKVLETAISSANLGLSIWPLNLQHKADGISFSADYDGGKLKRAVTRGNGEVGEDITDNFVLFSNVPETIDHKDPVTVRGEIVIKSGDFIRLNAESARDYKNPRNAASGIALSIHDKGPCKYCSIVAYDLEFTSGGPRLSTETDKLQFLAGQSFEVIESKVCDDIKQLQEIHDSWLSKRSSFSFEVDGIVVKIDQLSVQEELGWSTTSPKGQRAWKYPNLGKPTILQFVKWSNGAGKHVNPVAALEPVEIGGVTISNATLCNLDEIERLGIRIGDEVYVERRADVIPKVMHVIKNNGGHPVDIPKTCPTCGTDLFREVNSPFLDCINPECGAKTFGDIMCWIQQIELKEWGESIIQNLMDLGLVHTSADLYRLKSDDIQQCDHAAEGKATKLLRIRDSKLAIGLVEFMAGLHIYGISEGTAKKLIKAGYTTLEEFTDLNIGQVEAVDGLGNTKAVAFVNGLQAKEELVKDLLQYVTVEEIKQKKKVTGGKLAGKSFCFTGAIQKIDDDGKRLKRKDMYNVTEENGGEATEDVKKGLDFLVQADPSKLSSKTKTAQKLGIEILSEEAFFEMVEG